MPRHMALAHIMAVTPFIDHIVVSIALPKQEKNGTCNIEINGSLVLSPAARWELPVSVESTASYISIDCGLTSNTTYSDATTGITYASDDEFIDTGVKSTISSNYLSSSLDRQLSTVRSFPSGTRNCYVLKVKRNRRYLLRATFMYGNYDGLNQASLGNPLLFDLYVDVNFWWRMNISSAVHDHRPELIFVAAADAVSICLVKTGPATPFISALELRPLKDTIYTYANATQNLVLSFRIDVGSGSTSYLSRYPDDAYDRIWVPYIDKAAGWTTLTTTQTVQNIPQETFEEPSAVMQTAAMPINSSKMEFYWDYEGTGGQPNEFYANFYFAELRPNTLRAFNLYLNDENIYINYTPFYLVSDVIYTTFPVRGSERYSWSLNSTGLSAFPPILNALEVYTPMNLPNLPTDSGDVDAINAIKGQYELKKSWTGDPCAPKEYAWDGLNCSYGPNRPRITSVNLSSSALTGVISSYFAKLTEIESLDLSYNNLTGIVPDVLGSLPSLKVLNLTRNNLTGPIPPSLLKKSQKGSLVLRTDQSLCANGNSCEATTGTKTSKKKISTPIIVIICVVPVVLLVFLAAICFVCRARKLNGPTISVRPEKENLHNLAKDHEDNHFQLENRLFTYKELEKITNNFKRVLGKGGFGTVFHGSLEDGTQVAVKTLSQSSSQGTKEFLAEVQHLIRIHHKNLVSLVGYCMEGDYLALVYEYMSQGTLQDHITGKTHSFCALNWGKRLQIAIEAAQGLEYLHKGCKPPLVHRDVKTGNILLSEMLEAKIADFGLSKAMHHDVTNIPTAVVGTPGYLDPEYYSTFQMSEKSDVYSFGVVLLELITAERPILTSAQNAHIVQQVRQRLIKGNIEDVVDPKLQRDYDVNSIWKAADVAFKCTAQTSQQRANHD
ncbi:hypothetical protein Cni_G00145 [Canna indica]|uniref:non-specific serine/threonine protein kinase n=1 Tax=Canna indica TaxID=4628 RepID=A0AAQ3JMA1_9LILI|nr:hypothetical protein Cni_G00145 [Canna indica]